MRMHLKIRRSPSDAIVPNILSSCMSHLLQSDRRLIFGKSVCVIARLRHAANVDPPEVYQSCIVGHAVLADNSDNQWGNHPRASVLCAQKGIKIPWIGNVCRPRKPFN